MASDHRIEHQEGPEAARRFERTLDRLLAISKAELAKRETAYKKSRRAKKRRTTASR